jgi:predicted PurR-regulated permease PerM
MDPETASQVANVAPPAGEPATRFYRQIHLVALGLLIFVLVIHLLQEFATGLQHLLISAFLAYLILPLHAHFVRRGVPSALSFVLIVLLFLAASFGLGQMIYRSVEDFSGNWPVYQKNLKGRVVSLTERVPEPVAEQIKQLFQRESPSLDNYMKMLQTAAGTFFDFLSQVVLVLIYLIFILAERMSLHRRLHAAFRPDQAANVQAVVNRINVSIRQYLAVKTAMSFLGGSLTSVVLLLFGVDYPIFWGIVAFLLNFIPYLGSWVAVALPVLLSLVQFESPWRAVILLLILLSIQNAIGYAIEPSIAGSRLNLSPLVIILSLAFWGTLWGIVGMILAVPLVVVIKSILENIPETRPLATMLSNE